MHRTQTADALPLQPHCHLPVQLQQAWRTQNSPHQVRVKVPVFPQWVLLRLLVARCLQLDPWSVQILLTLSQLVPASEAGRASVLMLLVLSQLVAAPMHLLVQEVGLDLLVQEVRLEAHQVAAHEHQRSSVHRRAYT